MYFDTLPVATNANKDYFNGFGLNSRNKKGEELVTAKSKKRRSVDGLPDSYEKR